MEFEGRITRVLPARTGTRQDGSAWIELSFVFAYYENSEQHYEDSVLVSTFDTNIMAIIAPYVVKGEDGKVVIENDCAKLLTQHIPCRCGFTLKTKVVNKKDGSGYAVIQNNRCYKLEVATAGQGTAAMPQFTQQQRQQTVIQQQGQSPFPPQQTYSPYQQQGVMPPQPEQYDGDDLPF